jgi:hypothetical protein
LAESATLLISSPAREDRPLQLVLKNFPNARATDSFLPAFSFAQKFTLSPTLLLEITIVGENVFSGKRVWTTAL